MIAAADVRRRWPVAVAAVLLGATWLLLSHLSRGEVVVQRQPLSEFPATIGDHWRSRVLTMDARVLQVLKLTDHTLRLYQGGSAPGGSQAGSAPARNDEGPQVELYVGYYGSQRTGATYHSPQNCLPGAGWQMASVRPLPFTPPGAKTPVTINQVIIEKALDKQVILYWYHDRGRVVASEYWAKLYLVWDAITRNRTDGALIRISVPVTTTVEAAVQQGLRFTQDAWPALATFLPSEA